MKLTPFTEADIPILMAWLQNDEFRKSVTPANIDLNKFDQSKPYELSIMRLFNNDPVGWITLFNIEIGDKAEFGIAIPDRRGWSVAGPISIAFLRDMFSKYRLKEIYAEPANDNSVRMAIKTGFVNNRLTRIDFERMWTKCRFSRNAQSEI